MSNTTYQDFKYLIYKHTCKLSGKSYIGHTSKTLEERFKGHMYDVKYGSTSAFHNALRKYGRENFIPEILYICKDKETALKAEIELIQTYDTKHNGYNETFGGVGFFGEVSKSIPNFTKKSKTITIDGITYASIKDAIKSLHMDASTIYEYLKNPTGDVKGYSRSRTCIRPIVIDNIQYPSLIEASRSLKIYIVRVREYVDQNLHLTYKNINEYANTKRKSSPVEIYGKSFPSKAEAMKFFNLTRYELNLIVS